VIRFKLACDYGGNVLWERDEQGRPCWEPIHVTLLRDFHGDLALTEETIAMLAAWYERYSATLNWDNPSDEAGFDSLAELRDFRREGKRLVKRLKREFGPGIEVLYEPPKGDFVLTFPRIPKKKPKRLGRDPDVPPHRPP